MRYIKIPVPVHIPQPDPLNPKQEILKLCRFEDFLALAVWHDARWRDEYAKSYGSLAVLRIPLIPGAIHGVESEDWEILKDVVKVAQIAPELSQLLMDFFHAITMASHVNPSAEVPNG